jgi:hypothetical protein
LREEICDEISSCLLFGTGVVRWWLFVTVGHGGDEVLVGPGTGPGVGEGCNTRMLRRAPVAGRRREHLYGSHCLSVVGLICVGRSLLAVGRFRTPGRVSHGSVGGFALSRGGSDSERVRPRRYADCGQLMAGSTSIPARLSQYRFRSAVRFVGCDQCDAQKETSGPSPGPRVSPVARLLLPGRVRWVAGLGRSGGSAAYVGSWGNWLPAAGPGRLNSPARGRRPLHFHPRTPTEGDPSVGVRVGLFIPKSTD